MKLHKNHKKEMFRDTAEELFNSKSFNDIKDDRRFRPFPAGFYYSKQWQLPGTGQNRRSIGGWVLKPPLNKR